MIGGLGIEVLGTEKAVRVLGDLPRKLGAAERTAVAKGSLRAERVFRGKVSRDVLNVRTGAYRSSITRSEPELTPLGFEARVGVRKGPASPYAAIHETGGVIRAKGRLLAIPIGPALTPAGVARYKSPRDLVGGFWKSFGETVLFVVPQAKRLIAYFVGKASVTIPRRRPLGQTFDEVKPFVARTFAEEIQKATRAE